MQQAARDLHALGFKTLPIRPNSKEPACAHGVKDATADDAATDAYYAANPTHGIGVSGDGFVIFDFDIHGEKNGLDALKGWKLPPTLEQSTPSGGRHMIYRANEEIRPSVNTELAVDVRGWHSYIVCAPTPGYEFNGAEIANANDAVYAFLNRVRPKSTTGGDHVEGKKSETVAEGGRNDFLFKKGSSLRSDATQTDEMIRAYLYALNQTQCKPPLDDAELTKVTNSVLALPSGLSADYKAKKAANSRKRFDHAGIAEKLMTENGACFVDGMPAIRHGNRYVIGWHAIDREIIALDHNATKANQREVQHYLTVMAERRVQSPPNLIAFQNGILDIETMELREFLPDDVIPNIIPHDWNANAECQAVDDVLLKMACGSIDVLENLMEVVGVCMYRSCEFTQAAILLGEGSNGKSTYIRMIQALLGVENISSLDMAMLGKQFHTGQLAGKLANLGDDISNEFQHGDLLSVFKKIVDGNRVYADVKGVEGFEFEPYATLVFSANEFPRLADYTDGMIRRLFPIEFNAKFSKHDADYDPRIARKVTTKKACQRLAVLGIDGLHQVIANNGFTSNIASDRRVEEIKADNNSVLSWALENGFTLDSLNGHVSGELYKDYKSWCVEFGYQAVSHAKFTRQIIKEFGVKTASERVGGTVKKVFRAANN